MSVTPVAAARTLPLTASPVASATLGATEALGGRVGGRNFDVKKILLWAAAGAAAGLLLPVIPGGPIGGAAIGAALAFFLK